MADYVDYDPQARGSRARIVANLLSIAGWVALAMGLVWGLATIYQLSQSRAAEANQYVSAIAQLIAGLCGGVLLIGMGELLRQFDAFLVAYEERSTDIRNLALVSPDRSGEMPRSALPAHSVDELVVLLRELRDISLLNDDQRGRRLEGQSRAAAEILEREVPVLLREHNWIEARNRVLEARSRFPTNPAWDAFERQIEQTRTQVEQHDIDAAERHIADLTTLGAWDRVAEVVNELLQRHPDSSKSRDLAQRIRVTKNKAEAEQRARLMAQAQEATNKRDWSSALQCAVTVTQRFPKSPEAQALRMQLPVLRENAEIQTRQRMEAQIREHVRQHKYADALRSVQELLEQYPTSPQAEALREQLPKLQEKMGAAAR